MGSIFKLNTTTLMEAGFRIFLFIFSFLTSFSLAGSWAMVSLSQMHLGEGRVHPWTSRQLIAGLKSEHLWVQYFAQGYQK